MSARYRLALLTGIVVSGCGSATAGPGQPGTPTPDPGDPTAGVPPPPGGAAAAVMYRPVQDAAYTLTRHDSLTLQLPGGANQLQLIDRTAYLRLTITPESDGYLATIVLDSLQAAVGGVPAVLDSIIPAQGTRWRGRLTPAGELSALKADRTSTLGDQIGSNLRALFPTLPPDGVRPGMAWTDTTEVPIRADAFDAIERSLTRYRAESSDDSQVRSALKLESQGTYRRTGQGTQYDQKLEMTASGTRSAVHYLSLDGTLVSARGSDSGDMTITVPALGQTVPVKQAGTYSITSFRQPTR
ncbi:MAG TPA: hypothetical protein VHH32_09525 [Gemmatimonadales bacterium]|nr:hypothetical protein [Gemmatimonadales bacterium]